MSHNTAQLGACVSDLVASVHALVTEGETGQLLKQRLAEIEATCDAIILRSQHLADERDADKKP